MKRLLKLSVLMALVLVIPGFAAAEIYSGNPAVGNWIGHAKARVSSTAPFEAVYFQVTLFADGNAYWDDGHEALFNHGTGHGRWTPTADGFHLTVLWAAFPNPQNPFVSNGTLKLKVNATINSTDPNNFGGSLALKLFPAGVDPTTADEAGAVPLFGVFDIKKARRLNEDPPINGVEDVDMAHEGIVGAWFGKAIVNDPATSPFHEVVMMLNFLPDRNIVATDALELLNPHTTAHGGPWSRPEGNRVFCPFLWTNLSAFSDVNGYFKVRITGDIQPNDIDVFSQGTVSPVAFPVFGDPLDPTDSTGGAIGPFTIVHMERIKLDPATPAGNNVDRTGDHLIGSWYGTATADHPESSPFPDFRIFPTFFSRGNMSMNDSRESTYHHGSTFGEWKGNGDGTYRAKFIWLNMDLSAPIVFNGAVRGDVTLSIGANDVVTGKIKLYGFGRETIDLPDDLTGATELGTYTIGGLKRIVDTPPAGPDLVCTSDAITMCIGDRFQINIDVDTALGAGFHAPAHQTSLDGCGVTQGGIFWFFDPSNPEILVKVLDGCSINDHFWVLAAGATDLGYRMTVVDTHTGEWRVYEEADGVNGVAITDAQAFLCH